MFFKVVVPFFIITGQKGEEGWYGVWWWRQRCTVDVALDSLFLLYKSCWQLEGSAGLQVCVYLWGVSRGRIGELIMRTKRDEFLILPPFSCLLQIPYSSFYSFWISDLTSHPGPQTPKVSLQTSCEKNYGGVLLSKRLCLNTTMY